MLEPDWTLDNMAVVESFVEGRREDLDSELPFGGEWPWPARGSPCLLDKGPIVVSFEGTWGSLETGDAFASGSGTIQADFGDENIDVSGGCIVGQYYDDQGLVAVTAIDENILHQPIALFPLGAQAGVDYQLDIFGEQAFGVLNWMDLNFMAEPITRAYISDGTIRFEEIDTTWGGTVRGTIDARLVGGPD